MLTAGLDMDDVHPKQNNFFSSSNFFHVVKQRLESL